MIRIYYILYDYLLVEQLPNKIYKQSLLLREVLTRDPLLHSREALLTDVNESLQSSIMTETEREQIYRH